METIRRERWKGKGFYYVARTPGGKFLESRKVKGSNLSTTEAKSIFKQNKTFFENVTKEKRTNVSEYVITSKPQKKAIAMPRGRYATKQYFITGVYKGQTKGRSHPNMTQRIEITARSSRIGLTSTVTGEVLIGNARQAKAEAYQRFIHLLTERVYGDYNMDVDDNIMGKVTIIREGWVAYR